MAMKLRSLQYQNWEVSLGGTPLRIGRGGENQLVLRDTSVSRQHAVIQIDKGIAVVTDLGSSYGTTVNGQRVQRAMLKPGDVVAFGMDRWQVVQATGYEPGSQRTPRRQKRQPLIWVGMGGVALVILILALAMGSGDGPPYLQVTMTGVPILAVTTPLETNVAVIATPSPEVITTHPLYESVVQINAEVNVEGGEEITWSGSGTIITPDGLILTNAHVVLGDRYYEVKNLIVAMTLKDDQPPEPKYYAEVLQADPDLDIAVIRINKDLDGNPVDRASLYLPIVSLGNSDELELGESLTILGYPGIGGETITSTAGTVGGFIAESGRGARAFIKTSASISGGNSGGLASDADGKLVGVPTKLGYGRDDENEIVDCRPLVDTNRDGNVDEKDDCIPVGGFINALRPINLAIPLIEAAKRGEIWIGKSPAEKAEQPAEGEILFEDDFSSTTSGWDKFTGSDGSIGYVNGEYQIKVKTKKSLLRSNPGKNFSDIVITVDIHAVATTGEGEYGAICRYQDEKNYYILMVTEDHYYGIFKLENDQWSPIVKYTYSSFIPDGSQPFELMAVCSGDKLMVGVNSQILGEGQDSTFSGGDVGLVAAIWDTSGFIAGFDNFKVYAASP